MASLFLSYDRDHASLAKVIATALERAGHNVWWDRRIGGGTEYAHEIEQALESADVVVVLWTSSSIGSPWVRDEAGAGRDRGRLVPLSLEGTAPPIGFRQFQSIDLGSWRGRGRVPRLQEILSAIERQSKAPGIPERAETAPVSRRREGPSLNMWAAIGLSVTMFFVVVGLFIGRPWDVAQPSTIPAVAVTAADASTNDVAHALRDGLGKLQSIQAGSVQLLAATAGESPDLRLEVHRARAGGGVTLVLKKSQDGLWSQKFDVSPTTSASLNARMTYIAGRVLDCAADGLKAGKKVIRPEILKSYLAGCSELATASGGDFSTVVPVFEQVVKDAPRFKGGWAHLLIAKSFAYTYLPEVGPADRKSLEQLSGQARLLDSRMPELALAQVQLLPTRAYGEALQLLDAAHSRSPDNAAVLTNRSEALIRVGRLSDAIADAKEAERLDPLSPDVLNTYVLALAYSGHVDAARTELRRAERLWTGTEKFEELKYAFTLRFGDPKDLLETEEYKQGPPAWHMYVRTKIDPTTANVDRFVSFLRQLHARRGVHAGDVVGHSQPYGEFHREDEIFRMISEVPADEDISLFSDVAFRPALRKFRQDPRFMAVAKRMGLVDYWQKSGNWPDFCFTDIDQPYDCKAEAAKLK